MAVLNPPRAVETCVDKYLATAYLEAAGLRVPPTVVCQHADAALEAFAALGGDVVVKPLFGSEGRGMVRVCDPEMAWRTFRTLERTQSVLYLQQFIPHPGWDLRVFVLGGRVLTAMRRYGDGDWRTNVAQGGRGEVVQVSADEERLALSAACGAGRSNGRRRSAAGTARRVVRSGGECRARLARTRAGDGCGRGRRRDRLPCQCRLQNAECRMKERVFILHSAFCNLQSGDAGLCAQIACIWEATARKPGNVHRYRDFDDSTYPDFLLSAAAIAPVMTTACQRRVGATVLEAVRATRRVTGTNTNLGIVLLLAPLAAVPPEQELRGGIERVLAELDVEDARRVYEAIRLASPGGLGRVSEQDVYAEPTQTLRQVMALAADRDMVARQYANGFAEVFNDGVPALLAGLERTGSIEGAIISAHLHLMAHHPDTLIAANAAALRPRKPHAAPGPCLRSVGRS